MRGILTPEESIHEDKSQSHRQTLCWSAVIPPLFVQEVQLVSINSSLVVKITTKQPRNIYHTNRCNYPNSFIFFLRFIGTRSSKAVRGRLDGSYESTQCRREGLRGVFFPLICHLSVAYFTCYFLKNCIVLKWFVINFMAKPLALMLRFNKIIFLIKVKISPNKRYLFASFIKRHALFVKWK